MTHEEFLEAWGKKPIYNKDGEVVEVDEIYETSIWVKDVGQVDNQDLSINKPVEHKIIKLEGPVSMMYSLLIEDDSFKIIYSPHSLSDTEFDLTDAQRAYNALEGWGNQAVLRMAINGMVATIKELSK